MDEITFTIPGEPRGKERPRIVQSPSGKSVGYTPQKTQEYEEIVRLIYSNVARGKMFEGAIKIEIWAIFGIPKSYSKKRTEEINGGDTDYMHKPDWDNIAKIVCDSLNGLAWKDDCQVTDGIVHKRYGSKPRAVVKINGNFIKR